jgi:DNA damage-binding protein 1
MPSEDSRLIAASNGRQPYQYVPNGDKENIEEAMEISINDTDIPKESASTGSTSLFCVQGAAKSFVFGGYDGVLASLIIISAAFGGGVSSKAVVAVAFAAIFASALSIGITEYRSSTAHQDYLQAEKRRKLWQFKQYRDKEMAAMVFCFERRGMTRLDAQSLVSKMAQNENVFVDLMVVEDGLQISDDDANFFFADAFVMCISFASMGLLPVLVFLIGGLLQFEQAEIYAVSVLLSLSIMGALGMIKSNYSSSSSLYSIMEAVMLSGFCAVVAFGIGFSVSSLSW